MVSFTSIRRLDWINTNCVLMKSRYIKLIYVQSFDLSLVHFEKETGAVAGHVPRLYAKFGPLGRLCGESKTEDAKREE